MKKLLSLFMVAVLTLVGCSQETEEASKMSIKVGMTTDSGSVSTTKVLIKAHGRECNNSLLSMIM